MGRHLRTVREEVTRLQQVTALLSDAHVSAADAHESVTDA
mgnify:CR=1 FL=1